MLCEINAGWRPQNFAGGSKSGRKYGSKNPDHVPDPAPRPETLWETRTFDVSSGMWVRPKIVVEALGGAPEAIAAIPEGDGTGVYWYAIDKTTDLRLWTIEAWDFDGALDEKRRLCKVSGYRSGGVRLERVRT